ncbi:hypothetical protein BGZ79_008162 [Entomortierella chlamydospora]|nr:hypothetical protein BGZ79_008162 [Entomortierella chlamydospora]
MSSPRQTGTPNVGSRSSMNPTSGAPGNELSPQNNPTNPDDATATSENQNPVDANTATHIVVEHDRSGTVKTHVFSSKDGKPSLLGHSIPDLNHSNTLSEALEEKIQTLNTLVQNSIDRTKVESLDKIDALRIAIEENDSRVASQVSLATTRMIDNQIKMELVPKLERLETLILGNDRGNDNARSEGYSSGPLPAEEEDSHTSMEPMDRTIKDEDQLRQSERQSSVTSGAAVNSSLREPLILEKLSTIESNVDALCKVVIDGQAPPLTQEGEGGHSDGALNVDPTDSDSIDKLEAMRDEMLIFPETLKSAYLTMQELTEALTRAQEASASATANNSREPGCGYENDIQKMHEEQKQWQSSTLQAMNFQTDELGNLCSDFQYLNTGFKKMDADFNEWRRTHKLSLQVYLKYMYLVFKRTESVDTRIQSTIQELKDQMKMEPEHRTQLSNDLSALRLFISSLPDMIVSQLKQSNEVLGANVESGQASQESPADTTTPNSDSILGKLIQTVETLQANIALMMEKYAETDVSRATTPVASGSTPNADGEPVQDSATVASVASVAESEPLPEETDLERRVRAVEELLARNEVSDTATAEAKPSSEASEPTEGAPASEPAVTEVPPASGYIQRAAVAGESASAASEAPATPAEGAGGGKAEVDDETVPPILPARLLQELGEMNKNLTQLMDFVKSTAGNLAQGQNQLNENMQHEIQRVITAIGSLEAADQDNSGGTVEPKGDAAAATAPIGNVCFDPSNLLGEVMKEVAEVKIFTEGLDSKLVACHNDVKNVLEGSMQDSSVIGTIKRYIDTMMSDKGCASDVFLKAQIAEVFKTATDVHVMVEDIKRISNITLTRQEALAKKMEELHSKQGEGVEALLKKHDEGWNAWNEKNAADVASTVEWHDQHDRNVRGLDARRDMNHEELQSWHSAHNDTLESWHKAHDERLSELEKRHCLCHSPYPGPEPNQEAETEAGEPGLAPSLAPEDSVSQRAVSGTHAEEDSASQYAASFVSSSGAGHTMSQEFPRSLKSSSTSGIIVPEPGRSSQYYHMPGSYRERPTDSVTRGGHDSTASSPLDTERPIQRGMGESATYHGADPPTDHHSTTGRSSSQDQGAAESANLSDVQKELLELQEKYAALAQQFRENEESANKCMAALVGKGQEILVMTNERERIEKEFEEKTSAMDQEIARLKEKLASKKQKLKDANATIEKLYREGLGLSTGVAAEDIGDAVDRADSSSNIDSEIESTQTPRIPHYSPMAEAAEQFQQTLEEFKLQKAGLHHDIGMLEARKLQLLEEVAGMEARHPSNQRDEFASSMTGLESAGGEWDAQSGFHDERLSGEGVSGDNGDEEFLNEEQQQQHQQTRSGGSRPRSDSQESTRTYSTVSQQRRMSQHAQHGLSTGPSRSDRSFRGVDAKVPQLEADIKICKDGNISETLLSSKTLLTEEQFDRIQYKSDAKDGDDKIWSLSCDFKVRIVNSLRREVS